MNTSEDEQAALAYEFRRQLTGIQANAELLLDEAFGPLEPEQRDALEEIVASTGDVTTLAAHAFETEDPETVVPVDGESDADPQPHATDPDALEEITLGLAGTLGEQVAAQLERAGYAVRLVEPTTLLEAERAPTSLAIDCGVPTAGVLDSLASLAEASDSLSLLSTLETDASPAAFLGISGVLAPTATDKALEAALTAVDVAIDPRVGYVGDEADLPERLAKLGCEVVTPSAADDLESLALDRVDCLFLEATAVDRVDPTVLATVRAPSEGAQRPVVVVGTPPSSSSEEWVPTVGNRTFARKPPTSVDLAAELARALPAGDRE
ncbi:histidine kinase [Natronococcus amylolyticus DSM 10524]|uniref:Histidine kinase n=1 Tax=Natronococcus amylolyticus DSM 10524 TaxID=1227497 RepID=L9WZ07_9EURY|nr:hypothetical protein [Natronococcus amylolyticus]ELY53568.1 histidine kinase [Natronococcus amylolyticus DSM 10524]